MASDRHDAFPLKYSRQWDVQYLACMVKALSVGTDQQNAPLRRTLGAGKEMAVLC